MTIELFEEALRQYLVTASITDLDSFAVGETQAKLAGELGDNCSAPPRGTTALPFHCRDAPRGVSVAANTVR
jgi:hypothetical protein